MSDYELSRFPATMVSQNRIKTKKGRLNMDVPTASFPTAFSTFSSAAEGFAMTLSDVLHRKFAYSYLTYLQEVAQGAEQVRPNAVSGRPACRLICYELERLFRCHFFKPDEVPVGSSS